jgi:TolA-binding protein
MPAPADLAKGGEAPAADRDADSSLGGAAENGTGSSGERMVVVSGTVTVVVEDPIDAAGKVADLVEKVGGFLSARQQQSTQGETEGWATLTARIPAADLQDVVAQLGDIGRVDATELASTEVTAQARDLDARIKALQLSIDRLTDLLARSGDLADIVQAEQVLTDRQSQLEGLQSQRAALADEVSMSTVEIRLYQDGTVAEPAQTGFVGGLSSGWHALVSFLGGLVTVLGALLPWLAVAALVAVAVWPLVRRARRRAAERAAARPAAQPAPAYQYLAQPGPGGAASAAPPRAAGTAVAEAATQEE